MKDRTTPRSKSSTLRIALAGALLSMVASSSSALAQDACPVGGNEGGGAPALSQWVTVSLLLTLGLLGALLSRSRRRGASSSDGTPLRIADDTKLYRPSDSQHLTRRTSALRRVAYAAAILDIAMLCLVGFPSRAGAQVNQSQCAILDHASNSGEVQCTANPLQCWAPKTYFSVTVAYTVDDKVGIPSNVHVEGEIYCGTLKATCAGANDAPTCHDQQRRDVAADDTALGYANVSFSGTGGGFDAHFVTYECQP